MTDQPRKTGSRERVRTYLDSHGLSEEIFEFEQSTKTAAMAAEAMGCELGQIVKSLVAVIDDGRAVMALVAGDRRGDLAALAGEAGGESARMCKPDEVREATGYAIGGVCPFDLPAGLPVVIDDSLMRFEVVYPAAGTPASMVRLSLAQLCELANGHVARISQ